MPNEISRRNLLTTAGLVLGAGAAAALLPGTADAAGSGRAVATASSELLTGKPGNPQITRRRRVGALKCSDIAPEFQRPTTQAKPMARVWFPDAGGGSSAAGLQLVAKQIAELARGGFAGAEIAFLSDNTDYTNADARTMGFGSANWQRILKTVVRTANGVPGGFKIDLAGSAHWPLAVNVIDPNDIGQNQQLTHAYAKITAADLAAGTAELPQPVQRTSDRSGGPFLFVDTLVTATVVTVAAIDGSAPTFKLASLTDVTASTSTKTVTAAQAAAGTSYLTVDGTRYAGNAAGVPDRTYATAHGIDYATVIAAFGPDPADPTFPGKIDADGNRKRLADWQYRYQVELAGNAAVRGYTPSAGDTLTVGDLVLFATYHQGTGQAISGGASAAGASINTVYNRQFAISLYDTRGAAALADFWRDNILDTELVGLLKQNARHNPSDAIFEDSYEVQHDSPMWGTDLLPVVSRQTGYRAASYAPLFALGTTDQFDDTATATRILQDYTLGMASLYRDQHIASIGKWAATFGFSFKAQPEAGSTGVSGAEPTLGVQEGDNAAIGDGFRNLAAAPNLTGRNLLSDEGLTFEARDYLVTWQPLAVALNGYWGAGVNRVNVHGSPFPKTFNGYKDAWPGWEFGPPASFPGAAGLGVFDGRHAWWQDMPQFSNYIARTQAVLQAGTASVDLAVLEGSGQRFGFPSGNSLQGLLNLGFSYNILDESMLTLPSATVSRRRLAADGPAYQALIIAGATQLNVATVKTLTGFAKAGLPVILLDTTITSVYGTGRADNNDTLLAAAVAALQNTRNVHSVTSETALSTLLGRLGIAPAVSFYVANLQAISRRTPSASYHYLYNAGTSLAEAAAAGTSTLKVLSTEGINVGDELIIDLGASAETATIVSIDTSASTLTLGSPLAKPHLGPRTIYGPPSPDALGAGVSAVTDEPITIAGTGQPYLLDAWTGEITPIANYDTANGTTTVRLTLQPGDAAILALQTRGRDPRTSLVHATATTAGQVLYDARGHLVLRAQEGGTVTVKRSTGKPVSLTIPALPGTLDLSAGWKLVLQSWGPDSTADVTDPRISAKRTVSFSNLPLQPWSSLPASSAQLNSLGVTSISDVSGVGTYTRTFELPPAWNAADGAYLQLGHTVDIIAEVVVNEVQLDPNNVMTDRIDIGAVLIWGHNTIKIRIDTTLANRYYAQYGSFNQAYGLTAATLIPYVQVDASGA